MATECFFLFVFFSPGLQKRWPDRELGGRRLPPGAWGDVPGHRGSLWFVSLSITPHSRFPLLSVSPNAPQQPVAVLPLCVTVWELCRAGGSPRSAPGRRRGRQLVYYGPRRGRETGGRGEEGVGVNKRASECIGPRLRGVFSKREHRRGIRNDFEPSMYSFV